MKRIHHFLFILSLLFSCPTFIGLFSFSVSYADSDLPPRWIQENPSDKSIYWGVGEISTQKGDTVSQEEKTAAYKLAVTELSQMAGQMIFSSFRDYQKEVTGKPDETVAEQEVVSSIKAISEQFLQGIEVRDKWHDRKTKMYYVLVSIDRLDANRQIKENTKERETKLQKVINLGLKNLNKRLEKVETGMGRVDTKVKNVDKKVGSVEKSVNKVEKDLSDVDERVDKNTMNVSELFGQVQFVKDKIESLSSGEMNWTRRLARVKGIGAPNPNFPPALQRRSAEEAARMDAQSKLIEFANGLKMESKTFMRNYRVEADVKVREAKGVLRGAYQVGKTVFNEDGTAEVTMEADVKDVFPFN